ncbi:hypothetical protein E2C01_081411 [Portunus trituberculatus]|uniref:Cholecystokinin n=1 Tax=Portunus trituberculatus TaxID=210409 RepID=A0A5B7IYR4_PORTR|nr:hypothetical protein [Portunus trituberculatus]
MGRNTCVLLVVVSVTVVLSSALHQANEDDTEAEHFLRQIREARRSDVTFTRNGVNDNSGAGSAWRRASFFSGSGYSGRR